MFGSAILEVAIGMILIYLVLSLIMTSVQEGIHAFMKARARNLEQALLDLFQGDETVRRDFYNHPLIFALHTGSRDDAAAATERPSYIPRETFSAALMDVMEREEAIAAQVPEPLREAYDGMKRAAGARAGALRGEIERWYDATMDRASGRFKRKSQATLFLVSLALAVALNFNSIVLAQYLAVSPQQRQLVTRLAEETLKDGGGTRQQQARAAAEAPEAGAGNVSAADDDAGATAAAAPADPAGSGPQGNESAATQNSLAQAAAVPSAPADAAGSDAESPFLTDDQVRDLTRSLQETGLPIGWRGSSVDWLERGFPDNKILLFRGEPSLAAFFAWLLLAAGYLMTAFAIMLGAPFWFDVLNKFMVIRGTVKPTEKSRDEASEDRQRRPIVVSPGGAPSGS